MPKTEKGQFQSWNPQTKKWVLFEDGKIRTQRNDKYEGVRVEKDRPGSGGSESGKGKSSDVKKPDDHHDEKEKKAESNPWSFF